MALPGLLLVLLAALVALPASAVRPEQVRRVDAGQAAVLSALNAQATAVTAQADSLRAAYAAAATAAAAASDSTAAARANIATAEATLASSHGTQAAVASFARSAATEDPHTSLTTARGIVTSLLQGSNATEHMSSENVAVLQEVVKIIESTIYASMDSDHKSDKQSLADALAAVAGCHITLTDRQAPTGDIGGIEEDAYQRQVEQNRLHADVEHLEAVNATAWSELAAHMGGLQASQCVVLPTKRTTTNLDSYYAENSAIEEFIVQFDAQQKVYHQKREAQQVAKDALDRATTDFESNRMLLRSQYCDWKRVLVSACTSYDSCHDLKASQLSKLAERVALNKQSRIDVFKAGEAIVGHIKFLLGRGKKIQASDVNASKYDVEIPKVPGKEDCDMSGLTDSRWAPPISCTSWVMLAEGLAYTGKTVSAATRPLHFGEFQAFKAVYRGGSGIQCNKAYRSEYKWQTCHRARKGVGAWSFELQKNTDYVVSQPSWPVLPPQCKVPDTPTGDIVCDVKFDLASGDTLTAGWYEAFHKRSLGDNGGSITIDIYGKLA